MTKLHCSIQNVPDIRPLILISSLKGLLVKIQSNLTHAVTDFVFKKINASLWFHFMSAALQINERKKKRQPLKNSVTNNGAMSM